MKARIGVENELYDGLHVLVGVFYGLAEVVINIAYGNGDLQLAPFCLVVLPAFHPGVEIMQLGLAHGAFQAEQHAVVEVGGVIKAVLVQDERTGEPADFQEVRPVGRTPRKPGRLNADDNADVLLADFADQLFVSLAPGSGRAGNAEVFIYYVDHIVRPSKRNAPLPEAVLPLGAFLVFVNLAERGLPHVKGRAPGKMVRGNLCVRVFH
jgi:hypothetical protein